jgi:hypothetical protein
MRFICEYPIHYSLRDLALWGNLWGLSANLAIARYQCPRLSEATKSASAKV